MSFVHLHLHTEYSLLDGVCRMEPLMKSVLDRGQTAVAITDHGAMYGVIDFYDAAKKYGVKPIIGCEVYVAARTRFDREAKVDSEHNHLVLLCENNEGYKNLMQLVSKSFTEGFYGRPRVDKELLKKYSGGLIALSACLAGEVPRALTSGDYERAKKTALEFSEIFGKENYFLELQNHGIKEQQTVNDGLRRISREIGISLVATNDVHYIDADDNRVQKILICIQTNKTVNEAGGLEFASDEFYLKSEDEMLAALPQDAEAIENTAKIADRCNVTIEFGDIKLPAFTVDGETDNFAYLRRMAYDGLYEKYGKNPDDSLKERLDYELSVVNSMGYTNYYLIVWDFVHYAKRKGIPVGPGRGSGAGSLVAYCIGITGIDPIKYGLLFERFLNPERVSMPDFDIDFCYIRRQEVIDYVVRKYGADHVAQIITFGTMAARGAIRDVARALDIPYSVADSTAKLVPMKLNITIDEALEQSKELKNLYNSDERTRELIDMARRVEGMPRHASTHAAGVVITKDEVSSYVPLAKNDEAVVTQYTMTDIERLGLLKMDFLGLRTLTVIKEASDAVRRKNPDFDIDKAPLDDRQTMEMLSTGNTLGVFQFESAGMRSVLRTLKPDRLEDLIAVVSLYRPGPMDSIPTYIRNRHNPSLIKYKTPQLKPILDVTYGCIVYQEQVMEIFRKLAGYTLGRADIVRRAMSKKKHDVMDREREIFLHGLPASEDGSGIDGAVKRGIDEKIANDIFDDMTSFASYAFNKSHAAAYAFVSYQTAYLKCHYPHEFMSALLNSVMDNTSKAAEYMSECARLGITVLPPDIQTSMSGFTVSGENIVFGLQAIKNLGHKLIERLIEEREENGRYKSFYDFCSRLSGGDMNRRALESLVKSGACDNLGLNRLQMLRSIEGILEDLAAKKRKNVDGQIGFFDIAQGSDDSVYEDYDYPNVAELPKTELLAMEKEVTGLYISGHPMAQYTDIIKGLKYVNLCDIAESGKEGSRHGDNDLVKIACVITEIRLKTTKSNQTMAFATIEDLTGSIEMIVFPKVMQACSILLQEGTAVYISARISVREDRPVQLVCESMEAIDEAIKVADKSDSAVKSEATPEKRIRSGLYLKINSMDDEKYLRARRVMDIFEGNTPVILVLSDGRRMMSPRNLWVDINEPLLKELKNILDDKNVAFIK